MTNHQNDLKKLTPSTDEDSSGKIFADFKEENLCEEIQNDLTIFVDDMRQGYDYLFDVIEEMGIYKETDSHVEAEARYDKVHKARVIYNKHLA